MLINNALERGSEEGVQPEVRAVNLSSTVGPEFRLGEVGEHGGVVPINTLRFDM